MSLPQTDEYYLKRISKKFIDFSDGWIAKYILRPLFFVFPPIFLTLIATKSGIKGEVTGLMPAKFAEFIESSSLVIILACFSYTWFLRLIYGMIESYSKPEKELGVNDLVALIRAIDIVVSDKTKKINNEAKLTIKNKAPCNIKTINQIAFPERQIPLLIVSLRTVFGYIHNDEIFFRVGLMKIENNKPFEWYSFDPEANPPRLSPEQLSAPSSTISCAIRTRSIVIIENIQKELSKKNKEHRKFIKGNLQDGENGSQLAYPIVHPVTGEIEYVITIAGNKVNSLKCKYKDLYLWVINHFSVRIILEHSVLLMKEKVA